jgi:RNA polymerase sigma-70 factor (ECF subfamily)
MCTEASDDIFRTELTALIPHMRAFARSLCLGPDAEDLAQDALASAWAKRASFTVGTNLKAWLFTITRNQFYSDKRRSWRSTSLDPETAERTLVANDNPTATLELDEMRRALAMLAADQREALILIGAGGFSYEEASEICGVPVGTVKSRVSRARDQLALIFAEASFPKDDLMPGAALGAILGDLNRYSHAACA